MCSQQVIAFLRRYLYQKIKSQNILGTGGSAIADSFDASASVDMYGTIVSYNWLFVDGTSGTGKTTIHAFPKKGTYTVRLTVVNDQGYPAEASKPVNVDKDVRERRQ